MMKKEERVLTTMERLKEMDFLYCVDYDSNVETAYDHDVQCANDYCRCSTLHPTINSISHKDILETIVNQFNIVNEKIRYCIERICATLTVNDFYCNVCGGYYGEEMDSIVIENYDILDRIEENIDIKLARKRKLAKIHENVEYDDKITDDKIRKILIMEYGYLLDDLKLSTFSVIEIDPKDIVFPQKEYSENLNLTKINGYKNHSGICGIVKLRGNNGKFNVIDGYHRITANLNKPKIKVLISVKK